jgi:murein DD-endopeptidase MepM/ murein hydrolase activator NlpD
VVVLQWWRKLVDEVGRHISPQALMVGVACASMFALVAPGGQAQQPYKLVLARVASNTLALPMKSGFFSMALAGKQAWAGPGAVYSQGQSTLGQYSDGQSSRFAAPVNASFGGGMTLAISQLPSVGEIVRVGAYGSVYGIGDSFAAQIGPPATDDDLLEVGQSGPGVVESETERSSWRFSLFADKGETAAAVTTDIVIAQAARTEPGAGQQSSAALPTEQPLADQAVAMLSLGMVGPPPPVRMRDDVVVTARALAMGPPLPAGQIRAERISPLSGFNRPGAGGDYELVVDGRALDGSNPYSLSFDPLSEAVFQQEDAETVIFRAPAHRYDTRELGRRFRQLVAERGKDREGAYLVTIEHRIRNGETVSEVLEAAGLSPDSTDTWISAARRIYNLNRIFAGQRLGLTFEGPDPQLVRLNLDIGPRTELVEELDGEKVVASRRQVVFDRRLRVAAGTIESSLYESALSHGVPEKIVSEAAEVLGWELNFSRDLRPGATFRVAYEELRRRGGESVEAGRLLAVEINNRDKIWEGFYFAKTDEMIQGYFNREGKALGRYFMRYPVDFSRISSVFSQGRFHPVLKKRMPHYGVDFAAPRGTPVRAVADATVNKAKFDWANGNFVKLRHDPVWETGYAHLSRIAEGVQAGARVSKGQVIGYVGSTGRATGPHLHFAMYRSGSYVDPLKAKLPRTDSLERAALMAFRLAIDVIDRSYARSEKLTLGQAAVASADDGLLTVD